MRCLPMRCVLPIIVGFQRAIEVHGPEDRAQRRVLCIARKAKPASVGLQAGDHKPTASPSGVDQLLGCKARPGTEVCEVALHGARANPDKFGGVLNGSACGDERCEHVHLALSRGPGKRAAQGIVLKDRLSTFAGPTTFEAPGGVV